MRVCSVFGCSTHRDGVSMYGFPKKPNNIRRAWINFVKTTRKDFSVPASYSMICASHFSEECFEGLHTINLKIQAGYSRPRLRLKKDAIPTLLTETCKAAIRKKTGRETKSEDSTTTETTTRRRQRALRRHILRSIDEVKRSRSTVNTQPSSLQELADVPVDNDTKNPPVDSYTKTGEQDARNTRSTPTIYAVSSHDFMWLKQELQRAEIQGALDINSDSWLKQEIETSLNIDTNSDTGTWLTQEMTMPESQTSCGIDSATWLKQETQTAETEEMETAETQAALDTHREAWVKQELETTETQTAININSGTWVKQEVTSEKLTAINTHSSTWVKQEAETTETQTAMNTPRDTWLKQEEETTETDCNCSKHSQ